MKQDITKEQWNELEKNQKDLWYEKLYPELPQFAKNQELVMPNIGQMIEFLGIDYIHALIRVKYKDTHSIVAPDLVCDALWEAVKHKLKV